MIARRIILIIAAVGALAGCTVRSSGDPKPTSDTSSSQKSSESVAPKFADLLPARPTELDLAGVDPCADLLTEQQLRDLNYDLGYAHPPSPDHSDIHGGPVCAFGSTGGTGGPNRDMVTLVGISTSEGALAWVTDPGRVPDARPEVVTVQGFSALVLPHPKFVGDCKLVVDTADGQYLEATSSSPAGRGTTTQPYCDEAARVAGLAIQTISKSR